ncbi:SH3 domain-containing protein, partial [Streptococcus pluranimalium]
PVVFKLDKGYRLYYDQVITADEHTWLSYQSYSGVRRYVAIN